MSSLTVLGIRIEDSVNQCWTDCLESILCWTPIKGTVKHNAACHKWKCDILRTLTEKLLTCFCASTVAQTTNTQRAVPCALRPYRSQRIFPPLCTPPPHTHTLLPVARGRWTKFTPSHCVHITVFLESASTFCSFQVYPFVFCAHFAPVGVTGILLRLRCEYYPQGPVPKHHWVMLFAEYWRPVFTPIQRKNFHNSGMCAGLNSCCVAETVLLPALLHI